jgi:hypothetical protein
MTTENLAMLAVGQIIAAGVFALGVLVGCSLNRKDAKDDSNEGTKKDESGWHQPVSGSAEGWAERCGGSSARKNRETDSAQRAPVGRGSVWE